ncbi:MAG: cytochrome c oxidase subunit II, partial [Planctomycetaceae bacterium]|nr:cytochrome c oxidase subunit II [Planctomycetaceae bacterium]
VVVESPEDWNDWYKQNAKAAPEDEPINIANA